MNHTFSHRHGLALGSLLAFCSTANAQFTATVLNPPSTAGSYASAAHAAGGGAQVGFVADFTSELGAGSTRAALWNGSSSSLLDLHPTGFSWSNALGVSGNYQAGHGLATAGGKEHALLWNGTANSVVDLNPTGFEKSIAYAVSGSSQVGTATNGLGWSSSRAIFWQGNAASAVNLHPTGFQRSVAYGVSGGFQVGSATTADPNSVTHAILWNGSASSFVDLNPTGYIGSLARGVSGNSQVGWGTTGGKTHAMLWGGTAASYIDLNPTGFDQSYAEAVYGNTQVGYGYQTGSYAPRALLWTGSASGYIDLHSLLSSSVVAFVTSKATGISENGDIVGFGNDADGRTYAIKWAPVPEPGTMAVLGLGIAGLVSRRKNGK